MKLYLFAYDICTEDKAGRRRLRQVAKACESRGCRVQKSLFECVLTEDQFECLRKKLLDIMEPESDSLRIYGLGAALESTREVHGLDHFVDFTDALIF